MYLQGFSQYSFILLTNLLVLFSFSLLHTGNKPEISHTLICLSCYLCRNMSDSLYRALHLSATSFQELAACRITLKIIYFILHQSCILELSLTIPVFFWYHTVVLILFLLPHRCLVCLQSSWNCTTFCSKDEQLVWVCKALGISEQTSHTWSLSICRELKIIPLAFYFCVPVLLL